MSEEESVPKPQASKAAESDEESLMHGEDDFLDDLSSDETKPKISNNDMNEDEDEEGVNNIEVKEAEKEEEEEEVATTERVNKTKILDIPPTERMRLKKRKRSTSASSSDREEEEGDDEEGKHPTKRLKKKRAKTIEKEDEASLDDLLEQLEAEEQAKVIEEGRVNEEPQKAKTSTALLEAMFDEDDDQESEAAETNHAPSQRPVSAAARALEDLKNKKNKKKTTNNEDDNDPMDVDGGDLDAEEEEGTENGSMKKAKMMTTITPGSSSDYPKTVATREGVPVLQNCGDVALLRCTYASNPILTGQASPIMVEYTEETPNKDDYGKPLVSEAITSMMWGVYIFAGDAAVEVRASGVSIKINRRRNIEFDPNEEPNLNATFSNLPWFILMGNKAILELMASPFFTYRVRAARVDPRRVKFSWRTYVPIFYVYGLDEKIPLWSRDISWSSPQLLNLIRDTLYAHVELECFNASKSGTNSAQQHDLVTKSVRNVLTTIPGFEASLSNPADAMLSPAAVSITTYSTRDDRSAHIKNIILSLLKEKGVTASSAIDQAKTKLLVSCVSSLVTPAHYLFADLEKPTRDWDRYCAKQYIPVPTFSGISQWHCDAGEVVQKRFDLLKHFVQLSDPLRRNDPFPLAELLSLRPILRFNISWFNDWFAFARDAHDRESRKKFYAFFAASTIWQEIQEETERYGPLASFIFTAARRAALFDSNFIWSSENEQLSKALNEGPKEFVPKEPLTKEEQSEIMHDCLTYLSKINELAKSPYALHPSPMKSLMNTAFVGAQRKRVSLKLSKLLLQVSMLNYTVGKSIKNEILRSLPPIVVQSSTTYGLAKNLMTTTLHDQFKEIFGKDHENHLLIVDYSKRAAQRRKLAEIKIKPRVIIFDMFHRWDLEFIESFLAILKPDAKNAANGNDIMGECTHLIFTGLANSCGNLSGGGSLLWEVMEVGEYVETIVFKKTSLPEMTQTAPAFATQFFQTLADQKRQRMYHRSCKTDSILVSQISVANISHDQDDAISMLAYSEDERRLQLEANQGVLYFNAKLKNYKDMCQHLVQLFERHASGLINIPFPGKKVSTSLATARTFGQSSLSSSSPLDKMKINKGGGAGPASLPVIVFVYVRPMTKTLIHNYLRTRHHPVFNSNVNNFRFVTCHEVESDATILENATYIIITDLEYKRYGRVNYMHINTALEYAHANVFFLNNSSVDTEVERAVELKDVEEVFLYNDQKSQRYLASIGRYPLLREAFYDYFKVDKVRANFGLSSSSVSTPTLSAPTKKD